MFLKILNFLAQLTNFYTEYKYKKQGREELINEQGKNKEGEYNATEKDKDYISSLSDSEFDRVYDKFTK